MLEMLRFFIEMDFSDLSNTEVLVLLLILGAVLALVTGVVSIKTANKRERDELRDSLRRISYLEDTFIAQPKHR